MRRLQPPLLAQLEPPSRHIKSAQDVTNITLLHRVSVPQAWVHWASVRGVKNFNPLAGPQLDQFHSLIRVVMAGMGVALVPHCLVKDDIAAGLVSAPLKTNCYGGFLAT